MSFVLAPEHPLWGAHAKVERASQLLDSLNAEFTDWCERHPNGLVVNQEVEELDPLTGESLTTFTFDINPPAWGVVIGEFLHDLRTALNHVVVATTTNPTEKTQFPASVTQADYGSCWEMVDGVPATYLQVVEAAQPYNSGSVAAAHTHPLKRLVDLNNRDKHHLLLVTVLGLKDGTGAYKSFWEHPAAESVIFQVGRIEANTKPLEVKFRPEGGEHPTPSVGVVFDEPDVPSVNRQPVAAVLEEMLVVSDGVVDAFLQIAQTSA